MARRKTHPGHYEVLPSGSIRVRLSVAGKTYRKTLKGITEEDAVDHLRKKRDELERAANRQEAGIPSRIRFSELMDRFRDHEFTDLAPNTHSSYETSFSFFKRYFVEDAGDPVLERIHAAHLKDYFRWRRQNPGRGDTVSQKTVAKDRRVLHRLFSFAEKQEYREGNPARATKPPKSDQRTPVLLTEDELDRLLKKLDHNPMARLWILLLAETGLRAYSEALHLRWEDLDLQEGFLHVRSGRDGHRTKSGASRWVPLTPGIREALQAHAATYRLATYREKKKAPPKRSPWVFHHVQTHGKARAGHRVGSFQTTLETAVDDAQLPDGWRPHDLRHRRVTTWLAEGKSPVHVKEAMGHSSLAVTMGYTHLAREHLRDLVAEEKPPKELRELAT
jgi:site-specific recombinase XerD